MKPKTVSIVIAFLINLGLLLGNSASQLRADAERPSSILFPCCKTTSLGHPYCCQNCCFFRWNCRTDEHCAPRRY